MEKNKLIQVEVAYATPNRHYLEAIQVPTNSTIISVIEHSGVLTTFPEINLQTQKVGIFSKSCALTDVVKEGDRIEIYRPLLIDPKEARRTKAKARKKS